MHSHSCSRKRKLRVGCLALPYTLLQSGIVSDLHMSPFLGSLLTF